MGTIHQGQDYSRIEDRYDIDIVDVDFLSLLHLGRTSLFVVARRV